MKPAVPYSILVAMLLAAGVSTASAQTAGGAEAFRFPETHETPRSELRMREIPQAGTTMTPTLAPVTDTPESLELYGRCQRNADREATDIADMRARITGCLDALNQRRQAGQ